MAVRNEIVSLTDEDSGKRLDHFLAKHFPQVSRSYLQKQIEEKKILLNTKPARKGDILRSGDQIQVAELLEIKEREPAANAQLEIPIIYEDEHLAVIEKPAGLATHPVTHDETDTVVNWWLAQNAQTPQFALSFEEPLRAGIVHRLDTYTSGLLLLARSPQMLAALQEQFRARQVKKQYTAIVIGVPPKSGVIDWPIAHDPKNKRRMMAVRFAKDIERYRAKIAQSEFTVEKALSGYAVVRVRTLTGRMHQVRVHFAALGFPLLGDPIYTRTQDRQHPPFPTQRHYLHASSLSFVHPVTHEPLLFESKTPEDFRQAMKLLGAKKP